MRKIGAQGIGLATLVMAAACQDSLISDGDGDGGVPEDDDGGGDLIDASSSADAGAPADDLPGFCASYPPRDLAAAHQSSHVFYGDDGLLRYVADDEHNRIPDLGYAGYHFGELEPPQLAEVERVGPGDGDDTARVQAAIDRVAARAPDAHGVRGALVLDPGSYDIGGTLVVRASGMVLRGSGQGDDASVDTILRATGDTPHQRSVIELGAGGSGAWRQALPGTQVQVTSDFVQVGERSFDVDQPERLSVGDRVVVRHPSSAAWIAALGGGGASVAWTPGQIDIQYLRRVVAIDGHTLTLDVPVYNHLDRALAQTVVFAIDDHTLVRESGVESLRIDVVSAGGSDENHAWNGVEVAGAEDSWVSDVTALHFGYAGVMVRNSDRITVERSHALDPVAQVTGGRMYNFAVNEFAQEVLFADCEASGARHAFVSNGTSSVSGVVFLRGRSLQAHTSSEGHRRWSQALLYDNIVEVQPASGSVVGLYNRGDWGTQHGWASAHSVIWRYDTAGKKAIIQKPPTAQNWAIGTLGQVTASGPFAGPPGYSEAIAGELAPHSLYEAQLCDRLKRRAAGR